MIFGMKKIILFLIFLVSTSALLAQEVGMASYYADKFNNRKTASGIIYKKDSLVCAHPTRPFGSFLKVRNVQNDKEVIVKVIDRGPFVEGRILDLSYAAAKELDMIKRGVVSVYIRDYIEYPLDSIWFK